MKHKCQMKEQMYRDLMERYRYVVDHFDCEGQTEAYEKTVQSPAKRYYVSARWAAQMLAPMFNGNFDSLNELKPLKREMYQSLFKTVVRLSSKLEFQGKSLYHICQFAVKEPAPRFYVDHCMMSYVFNNYRNLTRQL